MREGVRRREWEGKEVEIRPNREREDRLKRFFPGVRRYRATRRSLCAENTDPYTINHCHLPSLAPRTKRNGERERERAERGNGRIVYISIRIPLTLWTGDALLPSECGSVAFSYWTSWIKRECLPVYWETQTGVGERKWMRWQKGEFSKYFPYSLAVILCFEVYGYPSYYTALINRPVPFSMLYDRARSIYVNDNFRYKKIIKIIDKLTNVKIIVEPTVKYHLQGISNIFIPSYKRSVLVIEKRKWSLLFDVA